MEAKTETESTIPSLTEQQLEDIATRVAAILKRRVVIDDPRRQHTDDPRQQQPE